MPLLDVPLTFTYTNIPHPVRRFLREADHRIDRFSDHGRVNGFVPSNYEMAFCCLRALATNICLRGTRFCEWGSGFGVVACLAALLDYESCGIEIDAELVHQARHLAEDFEIPVEFIHGSFIPPECESLIHQQGVYSWLETDSDTAYEELGLEPADMDLIFAYPWPDEEAITLRIFERCAGVGSILVTFHGENDFRVRRKIGNRARSRR